MAKPARQASKLRTMASAAMRHEWAATGLDSQTIKAEIGIKNTAAAKEFSKK